MVTNLTNTTWEIPAGWSASAGYVGLIHSTTPYAPISVTVSEEPDYDGNYLGIAIGYAIIFDDTPQLRSSANVISLMSEVGFWNVVLEDEWGFTITFGEGFQYATNPQLISWLEANGTLQGGETPTPKLYIGNKAVTSMSIGNKAILKMYVGNSLIYEKASGEESVSITLVAEYGGANEQASVFVKFGTPPTDTNDYDYNALDGERYLIDRDRVNVGNNLQIDVSTKAYIWLLMPDTKAGYKLNNGSLVNVGTGYANATEVTLSNGDTLSLVSTLLD